MSKRLYVKFPLFLSDLSKTLIFPTDFRRKLKYQILPKSVQWEPSFPCGQSERRMDMTKLTVAFCNFPKAPNNGIGVLQL